MVPQIRVSDRPLTTFGARAGRHLLLEPGVDRLTTCAAAHPARSADSLRSLRVRLMHRPSARLSVGHYLANRRLRLPWGTGRHSWDRRRSLRWPVAPTLKSRKKIFAAPGMWWTVWKRRCGVSLVPALLRKQFLWRQIWATTQTQRLRYAGRWQERTMVRETSLLPGSNDLRCVRR